MQAHLRTPRGRGPNALLPEEAARERARRLGALRRSCRPDLAARHKGKAGTSTKTIAPSVRRDGSVKLNTGQLFVCARVRTDVLEPARNKAG